MATINPESLVWFAAVVEKGNFSAAARDLGVARQVVHRRIAALEDEVEMRLFDRTTRRVRPTDVAMRLYAHAVTVREALRAAEHISRAAKAEPSGRFRVTAPPLLGEALLVNVALDFMERYPNVQLQLLLGMSHHDLFERDIDLAIRAGVLPGSSLFARKLRVSEMCWVASPELEGLHALEHPRQLHKYPFILHREPSPSSTASWTLRRDDEEVQVVLTPRLLVASGKTILAAARRGLGVTVMPRINVLKDLESGALVEILSEWRLPSMPVHAVYPSRTSGSPTLSAFLEVLDEHWTRAWPLTNA